MVGPTHPENGAYPGGGFVGERFTRTVEYRPFSDFSPEQLAQLTGAELEAPSDSSPDPLMRTIKSPGWFIHWNRGDSEGGRVSTIRPFGLMGDREGVEFELDQTVAVTDTADPGSVSFVHPRNIHHKYSTPLFDWVRVSRDEMSIERVLEGSPKVTDIIRRAAQMAYERETTSLGAAV